MQLEVCVCVCVPVCKESKTIFGERKQQQQRSSRQTGAYTGVFARHGRLVDGVSEKRKKWRKRKCNWNSMQIANAIADYDYYKNSRADTAAITARERKKTETRPRRYVAARLVGCLSVSSPLSPPPLGFSLRLLVVSFMSSAFLLRRHLAFCQLASFLISLCHQKTKKKILFFLRLKLLLFWATSYSYYCSRQDFHCRSSVSPVLPFIYRWWCKINKSPTFFIDFSKGTQL